MRTLLFPLAVLAALGLMQRPADAAPIVGTQAYQDAGVISSPDGTDVDDTSFTITFQTGLGGTQQTGDYIGSFGIFTNSLDTTSPGSFVFGDALTYGTFTPSAVLVNTSVAGTSRTLKFAGTFSPNNTFFPPGGFSPTAGILTITINEATVGGQSVLSASATLATAPAAVPEPSTIVLLISALAPIGMVVASRRRLSLVS